MSGSEEGAPSGDHQGMGDHSGAYAAGLVARAAAEPAEGAGDDDPSPIGEVAEPEMHSAEEDRREDERGAPAPGPVFDPLLEHAAENEFLGEGQHKEKGQEIEGELQRIRGFDQMAGLQKETEGHTDGKEIEVVAGADAPVVPSGQESVAGLADAA